MKVVIFCGGFGMRLREAGENTPKPMVRIGYRPILWHLMKYYAHFGHKDFILCLGYRADAIKQYFLNYDECLSNDFTLSKGGKHLRLFNSDIDDWQITFADTGVTSNLGQRLKAVQKYLEGEEVFMANYCDGLIDLDLDVLLRYTREQDKIGTFVSVKPNLSYHMVSVNGDGLVHEIKAITDTNVQVNGGYFVFKQQIFDYIRDGEELVHEPLQRLIQQKQLVAYQHKGFFACMDTFKDKQVLDDFYASGKAPWELWKWHNGQSAPAATRPAPLRVRSETA